MNTFHDDSEMSAPRDVSRFLKAQSGAIGPSYDDALKEVADGSKSSHWIWYIFPQIAGLGHSGMSKYYAIADRAEAVKYLDNPLLKARLYEICNALLAVEGLNAIQIFGKIDAAKVRSSMTLFDAITPNDIFAQVLDKYYGGRRCDFTLKAMEPLDEDVEEEPRATVTTAETITGQEQHDVEKSSSVRRWWHRIIGLISR
mgnify:CR=1 FL=1